MEGWGPRLRGGFLASRDWGQTSRVKQGSAETSSCLGVSVCSRTKPEVPGGAWGNSLGLGPPHPPHPTPEICGQEHPPGPHHHEVTHASSWRRKGITGLPLWVLANYHLDGKRPGPAGGLREAPSIFRPWPVMGISSPSEESGQGQVEAGPGIYPLASAGGHVLACTISGTGIQAPGSWTPEAQLERHP